jgi:manganese efflux pump family protein
VSWFSLFAIALALAMDAFAVAIVTGMTIRVLTRRQLFRLGFHFGLFQAFMFASGWLVGSAVHSLVAAVDHWVAFALLMLVGGNILWNAVHGTETLRPATDPTSGWQLVFLSFATSLDALAVGLSLAMVGASIAVPAFVIGLTAAMLTLLGMGLGRHIGLLWGRRVEVFGAILLIAIGIKLVWPDIWT